MSNCRVRIDNYCIMRYGRRDAAVKNVECVRNRAGTSIFDISDLKRLIPRCRIRDNNLRKMYRHEAIKDTGYGSFFRGCSRSKIAVMSLVRIFMDAIKFSGGKCYRRSYSACEPTVKRLRACITGDQQNDQCQINPKSTMIVFHNLRYYGE